MKRSAAIMMTVTLTISAALAVASILAATSAPSGTELAQLFGAQLDCATQRAAGFAGESRVDGADIVKAVDRCMSTVSLKNVRGHEQGLASLAVLPLKDADRRRDALIDAVRKRVDLCMNAGVPAERFNAACPQLFVLDSIARRKPTQPK